MATTSIISIISPSIPRWLRSIAGTIAVAASLLAFGYRCAFNSVSVDPNSITGYYYRSSMLLDDPGTPLDLMPRGGTMHLSLRSDLTTDGEILLPLPNRTIIYDRLIGTFTVKGDTVTLSQDIPVLGSSHWLFMHGGMRMIDLPAYPTLRLEMTKTNDIP